MKKLHFYHMLLHHCVLMHLDHLIIIKKNVSIDELYHENIN